MSHIAVVGAGQAGSVLVAKLRALGHAGAITLIGAEPVPPYQRPPLSKKYLLGELGLERLYLRPEAFYAEHDIALRLGAAVTGIDPAARTLDLGDDRLAYDQLALTTGATPRRLPAALGGELAGVHLIRTLGDADRIAPRVIEGARVVIVGGGYIGLEAAAVAAARGMRVTLVEAAPRILSRVAAAETADYFRDLHRGHGVDIREGTGLERLLGEHHVTGARLTDGTELACDLVLVGIGVVPETALAEAAGLAIGNGVEVDTYGRASAPGIWAAGDCTAFPYHGRRVRLESVQNAIDQAEAVAANMLGAEAPYTPHPWFWSDQYDVKLQIAGLGAGHDRLVVRPGRRAGSVSHWYFDGATLLAVDAMNDPRAYMLAKRMLEAGRSPDLATVADPDSDLRAELA